MLQRNDELLEKFLNELNSKIPQAVEFRHKSWYKKEVYHLLDKYNTGYCIVSCPEYPTHIEVTSDFAYIRWHGKEKWYSSNYSKTELEKWAQAIKNLDAKNIYGYFNNDFHGYAVENARTLQRMIFGRERPGVCRSTS